MDDENTRPLRRCGIEVHPRETHRGDRYTILKEAERSAYFRLSPRGWWLWCQLDGETTIVELIAKDSAKHRSFAPDLVINTVAELARAGFLTNADECAQLAPIATPARWQRVAVRAHQLLSWRKTTALVDPVVSSIHRRLRWLYTRPAQIALAICALAGVLAFALEASPAAHALAAGELGGFAVAGLVVAIIASIALHELGHALTAKHFGYSVDRVGFGWSWLAPFAFVDTSDMWLSSRGPRVVVALAGPYVNVLLAGVAALVAWALPAGQLQAASWAFALASYLLAFWNLNPLLERDGYYVLMDWLEIPNLRRAALTRLRRLATGTDRAPTAADRQRRRIELAYAAGALAYLAAMAVAIIALYRGFARDLLAQALPDAIAGNVAWGLAIAAAATVTAAATAELLGIDQGQRDNA